MTEEGKLTTWKDDKGFGFITPASGEPEIFVHVSAFVNRRRRPVMNDRVKFHAQTGTDGRRQAANVSFHGDIPNVLTPVRMSLFVALGFLAYIGWSVYQATIPSGILWLYILVSGVTFVLYGHDKSAAQKGRRRVPESSLHFLELIGGWPGALVAQRFYHHKSAKLSFQLGFWFCVIINCAVLIWLS